MILGFVVFAVMFLIGYLFLSVATVRNNSKKNKRFSTKIQKNYVQKIGANIDIERRFNWSRCGRHSCRRHSTLLLHIFYSCNRCCLSQSSSEESVLSFRVSIPLFLISMFTLFGTFFLACFGGIGMAALPTDLINEVRKKKKNLKLRQFSTVFFRLVSFPTDSYYDRRVFSSEIGVG